MKPPISLYRQIAANKRKTRVILFTFMLFAILLAFALTAYFDWSPAGTVLVLIGMAVLMLIQYGAASSMVLGISGAQPARREDYPFIYHTVEGLAIAAGIPVPKCYIINSSAPNAFATGRNPQEGVVAITAGLIEKLNNEEIEGVLAHEIAHIQNYDIRLATIAIAFVGIVAIISEFFSRSLWLGGMGRGRSRSKDERDSGSGILAIFGLVFIILAPIFSRLLQLSLSRRREYAADTAAAWLTRNPLGLANALRKIAGDPNPLQQATDATAALYIVNPLNKKSRVSASAFSTHPPIEERIEILERLAYKI